MQRIDYILVGYRRLQVSIESKKDVSNLLLKLKLNSKIGYDGSFVLKEKDYKLFSKFSKKIPMEVSALLGLPGVFQEYKKRIGTALGFLFAFIMIILLSNTVWELRLDCETELDETETDKILETLSNSGLNVGKLWWGVDENRVENSVLNESSDVSWISIYRKGTVAIVELSLKEKGDIPQNEECYSNVVAKTDAVIEEITVNKGVACVKPGDVVKCGDILISGIYPEELGGGFCHAEGVVRGRVSMQISVEVSRIEELAYESEPVLLDRGLKLFDFHINIFKKYRNSQEECVIIEKEKPLIPIKQRSLPFSVVEYYEIQRTTRKVEYTDTQMIMLCKERMQVSLREALKDYDLIKLKTVGEFTDFGYRMDSTVVCSMSVSEDSLFNVD